MEQDDPDIAEIGRRILGWYDTSRRHLPWRALPGQEPDPYHVWLSEIMLQQTTVATVGPYFEKFLSAWPDIGALAGAELDDILRAWAGLGYYARARNLHKCAQVVAGEYGGRFPADEDELRKLPGVGPYTAAAIAAIAFNRPGAPVDGNIERVAARLYAVRSPLPGSKKEIHKLGQGLYRGTDRPGDYAQALMDLGAGICTPKKPKCSLCPVSGLCRAEAGNIAANLPARAARKNKPKRYGVMFWLMDGQGRVFIRRRPEKGLLGGMMEFPSTPWEESRDVPDDFLDRHAPADVPWQALPGEVRHVFTHFDLRLRLVAGQALDKKLVCGNGRWVHVHELFDLALPTVMARAARYCLGEVEKSGK